MESESLVEIKQRLANEDAEVRIDALLDVWEYGTAGIELVIEALSDKDRKVRQLVQLLLLESDEEIDWYEPLKFNWLYGFAIANFSNTLVTCWYLTYKKTHVQVKEEDKICVWELQSDRIIYTTNEMSPCILSTDGWVLIYATAENNIVVRDLMAEQDLCTLQGHDAPVTYLALSEDREFIASYSSDRQIKIWAIPNLS